MDIKAIDFDWNMVDFMDKFISFSWKLIVWFWTLTIWFFIQKYWFLIFDPLSSMMNVFWTQQIKVFESEMKRECFQVRINSNNISKIALQRLFKTMKKLIWSLKFFQKISFWYDVSFFEKKVYHILILNTDFACSSLFEDPSSLQSMK
jgi:hypothetical protein